MINKAIFLACLCAMSLMMGGAGARALESPWRSADYIQARLLTATEASGAEGVFDAALELRLAEGWHVYWRMPGEGGLPPRLDWEKSTNLKSVAIDWPLPQRYETIGLQSFGYSQAVIFPLRVTAAQADQPVRLMLAADIMACKDICVPQALALELEVPAGAAKQGMHYAIINAARGKIPAQEDLPTLSIKSVVLGPDALVAHVYARDGLDRADLFVEAGDLYIVAPPELTQDEKDPQQGILRIAKPEGVDNLATALSGQTVTLTLTDGRRAVEKSYPF